MLHRVVVNVIQFLVEHFIRSYFYRMIILPPELVYPVVGIFLTRIAECFQKPSFPALGRVIADGFNKLDRSEFFQVPHDML